MKLIECIPFIPKIWKCILELSDRITNWKDKLKKKSIIEIRENCYYICKENSGKLGEQYYCKTCYEKDNKLISLEERSEGRFCHVCFRYHAYAKH